MIIFEFNVLFILFVTYKNFKFEWLYVHAVIKKVLKYWLLFIIFFLFNPIIVHLKFKNSLWIL